METQANNTNPSGTSNATSTQPSQKAVNIASTPIDNKVYSGTIQCAIRRRPGLVGLPGQNPEERIYKIGASLDVRSRGNLRGVTGELESKFMPSIIGLSINDPGYRKAVEEYWSSIGKPVPADEDHKKDHEKGIKIYIEYTVVGKARKERLDSALKVAEKLELLGKWLITPIQEDSKTTIASLSEDSVADFLLLSYCLKYSKVANSFEDVDKSPKIEFYIYEKAVYVKQQLSVIDLRQKAIAAYQTLESEERKTDAVLLLFGEKPSEYESTIDKLLKIDELYNSSVVNMKTFVDYLSNENWESNYLVKLAISMNKLRNPANTNAIYYGDLLIGTNIEDAVLFLNNDTQGKDIKAILLKETSIQ